MRCFGIHLTVYYLMVHSVLLHSCFSWFVIFYLKDIDILIYIYLSCLYVDWSYSKKGSSWVCAIEAVLLVLLSKWLLSIATKSLIKALVESLILYNGSTVSHVSCKSCVLCSASLSVFLLLRPYMLLWVLCDCYSICVFEIYLLGLN